MKRYMLTYTLTLLLAGCGEPAAPLINPPADEAASAANTPAPAIAARVSKRSLEEARQGFATARSPDQPEGKPAPEPPAEIFKLVRYPSPVGELPAYLTPDPGDGVNHPAIVWITGGDCNSIGDVWKESPRSNDQTAAAYRKAGIVMLFPSLRGGNDNPGLREGFFGEVDDVIAAAEFVAGLDYVDPERIYLGGHSTGGTLVMLVAEMSGRFRAVFSFGPVDNVLGYGPEYLPFDTSNQTEVELRSPIRWLESARSPLFVFEGRNQPGNYKALQAIARAPRNRLVQIAPVPGVNHFSILAPMNELIAAKILRDDGATINQSFSEDELATVAK